MCSIAGFIETTRSLRYEKLYAIVSAMADTSDPPMLSSGQYAISFNGEIYNFEDSRKEIESEKPAPASGAAIKAPSSCWRLLIWKSMSKAFRKASLRKLFAYQWSPGDGGRTPPQVLSLLPPLHA
jgi:Glutamine amidotransferase domain